MLPENWEVIKYGKSRYLSSELLNEIDLFLKEDADVYVLNIGCVDAPPREIPEWFSDITFKRKYEKLYPIFNLIYKLIKALHLRKYLVVLRSSKPWVSIDEFKMNMETAISSLKKETGAEIILLGINAGTQRLEEQLPGILDNYVRYNRVLENMGKKKAAKFIDVRDLNYSTHFPDGVHYNENGHKVIAERILEAIIE